MVLGNIGSTKWLRIKSSSIVSSEFYGKGNKNSAIFEYLQTSSHNLVTWE